MINLLVGMVADPKSSALHSYCDCDASARGKDASVVPPTCTQAAPSVSASLTCSGAPQYPANQNGNPIEIVSRSSPEPFLRQATAISTLSSFTSWSSSIELCKIKTCRRTYGGGCVARSCGDEWSIPRECNTDCFC